MKLSEDKINEIERAENHTKRIYDNNGMSHGNAVASNNNALTLLNAYRLQQKEIEVLRKTAASWQSNYQSLRHKVEQWIEQNDSVMVLQDALQKADKIRDGE